MTVPDSYIIDVCATCGRHAVYPFTCGHRSDVEHWTVPITVKPTTASKHVLAAIAAQTPVEAPRPGQPGFKWPAFEDVKSYDK